MASRATSRAYPADWRAAFRRSLARAAQLIGAVTLFAGMAFLALALVSYHQTDPSMSTAAGGPIGNWMGRAGAWVAGYALFAFGLVSALLLPLLYAFGRKLWREAEEDAADEEDTPRGRRWWRTVALLLLRVLRLATSPPPQVLGRGTRRPAPEAPAQE